MSHYRRGANLERKVVNDWACEKNTVLAGRFAGSKCKGKIKVDVVVIQEDPYNPGWGKMILFQCKKSKCKYKGENAKFMNVKVPKLVRIERRFLQVE